MLPPPKKSFYLHFLLPILIFYPHFRKWMGVPLVGGMVCVMGIGMGVVLDVRAARLKCCRRHQSRAHADLILGAAENFLHNSVRTGPEIPVRIAHRARKNGAFAIEQKLHSRPPLRRPAAIVSSYS